jgi:hypothetical protein
VKRLFFSLLALTFHGSFTNANPNRIAIFGLVLDFFSPQLLLILFMICNSMEHVVSCCKTTACNMAKISISEASRLTGKNRSTLHRHIKSGKLSTIMDGDVPVLDTSELARVYSSFKSPVALQQGAVVLQSGAMRQVATGGASANATVEIELLQLKLQHAEEKMVIEENRRRESEHREREAREEINRLLNIVEKQTYLLAAAPEQEAHKENLPANQSNKGWLRRLFD